jgi:hypothetical protein
MQSYNEGSVGPFITVHYKAKFNVGLYLGLRMGRYEGPYQTIIVGIHEGL